MNIVKTISAVNATTGIELARAVIEYDTDPVNPLVEFDQVFSIALCSSKRRDYTWSKHDDVGSLAEWVLDRMRDVGIEPDELYLYAGEYKTHEEMDLILNGDFDPWGYGDTLEGIMNYDPGDPAVEYAWKTYITPNYHVFPVQERGNEYVMCEDPFSHRVIGIMWATNKRVSEECIPDAHKCATVELAEFSAYASGEVYGYGLFAGTTHIDSHYGIFGLEDTVSEATREVKSLAEDELRRTADLPTCLLGWIGLGWRLDEIKITEK